MTQEEKELLIKDLCGRIPYGVRMLELDPINNIELELYLNNVSLEGSCCVNTKDDGIICSSVDAFKPYLFPLSSMTEEQKNEFNTKSLELQLKVIDDEIMYEEATEIEDFLKEYDAPLSDWQKTQLYRYWGENVGNCGDLNLPFQAYTWDKVKYKGNPIARLTFPLLIIFIIIMTFVVRPIHWFIKGSWWFNSDSKIEKFCNKWWIAIFGE